MSGGRRALVAAVLLGLPLGLVLARCAGSGQAPEAEVSDAPALPRGDRTRELLAETAPPVRVELATALPLPVAGRVLDALTREPLPRFQVVLVPEEDETRAFVPPDRPVAGAEEHASADGRFAVTAAHEGPHFLVVWAEHGETACRDVSVGPQGADEDLTVLVATGIRVRGAVVDCDGTPVADAWVAMDALEPADARGSHTDADGSFDLGVAQPGEYRVTVESAGRPSLVREGLRLTLGRREETLRLALPQGAAVAGSVRPWERDRQAEVVFTHATGVQRRAAVSAAGRYELARLTPGAHHVHVEHCQPSSRSYVAESLRGEAEVVLVDGARSAFDVTDPVATMARVRVRVLGPCPAGLEVVAVREHPPLPARASGPFRVDAGATGVADLDALVPGRWRLELRDGGAAVHRTVIDLAPQEEREERVILR